ncbi:phage head completion protein [Rhodobacter maris]|uniref:Head-tail joining protein n=1 Tax=Rhodobacter maris TaxID=446682 RepID=A0A285TIB2_9RHOB|nr:head-tail adaptor protein [Rhodobacter maris]SOC21965.1 head-tail joining protein [Rhodobacter maris]
MARLDRRIQFRRAGITDTGFSAERRWTTADPAADDFGAPIWASRRDVSDAERALAGWTEATVVSRFVVVATPFTLAIRPVDRLVAGGRVYEITGIKEIGARRLEITAEARVE